MRNISTLSGVRMKPAFPTVVLLLFVFVFAVIGSYSATLTVTKTADTNDGVCDADCSLREAVGLAAPGDTIVFSELFNSRQTITLGLGQMNITGNLTMNGTGSNLLSVSANSIGRIFYVSGGATVNLRGMKLKDGKVGTTLGDAIGGAVRVLSSTVNFTDVEFTNNTALYDPTGDGRGGAVYGADCALMFTDVNINHNISPAGAIHIISGTLGIRDSIVNDNSAGMYSAGTLNVLNTDVIRNPGGGAVGARLTVANSLIKGNGRGLLGDTTFSVENSVITENTDAGLTSYAQGAIIRNSIISNNHYSDSGGGIVTGGTMYISNSAIVGNSAGLHGGGITVRPAGQLFLTNSTVSGNIAGTNLFLGSGGGVYGEVDLGLPPARITLTNSTIANNRAGGKGGGFRLDPNGTASISNTIIAGNTSTNTSEEDVSGVMVSNGINLIENTTGSSGWIPADLLNQVPLLGPLGNNGGITLSHPLLPGSPAINSGNNSLAVDPNGMLPLTVDQRGFPRFIGSGRPVVDIGAYEASYSLMAVTVGGRVVTLGRRGIDRTRITLDDGSGNILYTQTNPFGYFRFVNLIPGITYTRTVSHKYYSFASPQFFTADQDRSDLNFGGL
jgi:CSLREA domain-containing protein